MPCKVIWTIFLIPTFFCIIDGQIRPKVQNYEPFCDRVMTKPYFEPEMVMGKPWRIFYTWNVNIANKCLDLLFRNATKNIIHRIWTDMYDYMETQPYWDAATLHVTTGNYEHELLLFADQGPAGRFHGVANLMKEPKNLRPPKGDIPLLKFIVKLFKGRRILFMMDCGAGTAALLARRDDEEARNAIISVADSMGLDPDTGFRACVSGVTKA